MSNYCELKLQHIGLKSIGRNCAIHETVQFFSPQNISIGDNVRIDCFCVLSAGVMGIQIGNDIHIGAGAYLFGSGGRILLEDLSGLSPRACLFTATDDFVEGYLRGPNIAEAFRKVRQGDVTLALNAGVGAGSVVLPGVRVGVNACVGALTVVSRSVPDHVLVAGNPARIVAQRDPAIMERMIAEFRSTKTQAKSENNS